jgi:hypothetical protein
MLEMSPVLVDLSFTIATDISLFCQKNISKTVASITPFEILPAHVWILSFPSD